mgnify:CR=1 FL=1
MTHVQMQTIEQYILDMSEVRDVFQYYTAYDKIDGVLQFLVHTGDMNDDQFKVWHKKFTDKAAEVERKKGF